MPVVGEWTLHYDWGCSGNYNQAGITFNNDGTFSSDSAGKWVQTDGTILFRFDNSTAYGGNVVGNAMVGTMLSFDGSNGCWYAIKVGSTTMSAKERKPEFDASGNKTQR
jgi:hypothetical protein